MNYFSERWGKCYVELPRSAQGARQDIDFGGFFPQGLRSCAQYVDSFRKIKGILGELSIMWLGMIACLSSGSDSAAEKDDFLKRAPGTALSAPEYLFLWCVPYLLSCLPFSKPFLGFSPFCCCQLCSDTAGALGWSLWQR